MRMFGTGSVVSVLAFCNLYAVKPLPIIPICIIFPQLYISSGPEFIQTVYNYARHIISQSVVLLYQSFRSLDPYPQYSWHYGF